MRVLYINNGFGLGTAKSGGATRQIEIMKRLARDGVSVVTIGTRGLKAVYDLENAPGMFVIVRASLGRTTERSNVDRIIAYVVSTFDSIRILFSVPKAQVVYSPSDYFCDVIPSFLYAFFCRKTVKWIAMIHHLSRSPFSREGSIFLNLLSWIGQRLSFVVIAFGADLVMVYDTPEGRTIASLLQRLRSRVRIEAVWNGVDICAIDAVSAQPIAYDACFAGGLRASKGIYDLLTIWKKVCMKLPRAIVVIAGGGTVETESRLRQLIIDMGLSHRVKMLGALSSANLYAVMKASKMFLSTSREEGWGISLYEALACRIPVIAFDLPAFGVLQDAITRVPLGDNDIFSKQIITQLIRYPEISDPEYRGRQLIEKFDWDKIAARELTLIYSLAEGNGV